MAFQNVLLPDLAAATTGMLPTVANALMRRTSPSSLAKASSRPPQSQESPLPSNVATGSRLPDFLRDADLHFIAPNQHTAPYDTRSSMGNMSSSARAYTADLLVQRKTSPQAIQSAGFLRRSFSTATVGLGSRSALGVQRPLTFTTSTPQQASLRSFYTASVGLGPLRLHHPLTPHSSSSPQTSRPSPLGLPTLRAILQSRGISNGGIPRYMLASIEATANKNPNSATAQNNFYQALLKANMPGIIVERYQTGRFAKNQAVDEAYATALSALTGSSPATSASVDTNSRPSHGLTPAQIQAVGQAVAAHAGGGRVAVSQGTQGVGGKDGRIHVVVDESLGSIILKWTKFLAIFGFVCYASFTIFTMVVELVNTLTKRTGAMAKNDSEVKAEAQKSRFSDVHGCDEAKEELQELVEFLKSPEKFSTLGGKLPKGVLLVGPPGTGKTLLARAVAGEAGVPFFYMSGSEFDEVYVGVGAKRVRELFNTARAKSPAIIFIDELDAIGGKRNSRDAAYVKQTLNQLLTELDGFEQNSGIVVIGATNFPKLLDKALTRPGRFDRHVMVELPDVRGRLAILKHHAKKIKMAEGINLQSIAQLTGGLSGAELENIVNSAAIHASKGKKKEVGPLDFDWAKDKIIMGAEKKSMVLSPEEKKMTAYHEAGHALVNLYSKKQHLGLYKVTILPRGYSLGHTSMIPEMDKHSWTSADFVSSIETAFGGKIAEELAYGNDMTTSGVSADIEGATTLAFNMIVSYGMSDKLGPMEYGKRYQYLSSGTREAVESEVQRVLNESYARARALLVSKRNELDLLAQALVDYETLDKSEVEKVIRGEKLAGRVMIPRSAALAVPKQPNPLEEVTPIGGGGKGDDGGASPPPPPPPAAGGGLGI